VFGTYRAMKLIIPEKVSGSEGDHNGVQCWQIRRALSILA
jgi:hypothetical protein